MTHCYYKQSKFIFKHELKLRLKCYGYITMATWVNVNNFVAKLVHGCSVCV